MRQPQLFDMEEDEWQGMPEFVQDDLSPHRVIYVRFRNAEDVAKFEELMGQRITEKQKTIWFPYAEPRLRAHLRYVDEE
jgi:hypothetical protein